MSSRWCRSALSLDLCDLVKISGGLPNFRPRTECLRKPATGLAHAGEQCRRIFCVSAKHVIERRFTFEGLKDFLMAALQILKPRVRSVVLSHLEMHFEFGELPCLSLCEFHSTKVNEVFFSKLC